VPFADVGGKELWYDEAGSGPALVLTHAGVADSTMWDELVPALAERHRVIRYDLPGYGRSKLRPGPWSHVDDLRGLLDRLGVERAALVGLSHGGRVDLEFTLEHPERVEVLVLVAPGLPEHDWSAEAERADEEEERLFEAGDLEGAAEVNLRMWVDGPRRGPDAVPEIRERVRAMVLRSFELYREALAEGEPGPVAKLDPPATARLGELDVPTLVVYGDADTPDIVEISERLAEGIPGARKVVIPDVAHMLPMERPEEFARLVLDFLAEAR
jgi:pimeloyl-ACP methyl ester carboxylesterase